MMEYSSSVKTTRKMIPAITSTKTDKLEMVLAGVEAGEKMLVP
jgi:hypothetical protein